MRYDTTCDKSHLGVELQSLSDSIAMHATLNLVALPHLPANKDLYCPAHCIPEMLLAAVTACGGTAGQAERSLAHDDVDSISEWQRHNVNPLILDHILVELSDGICHLVLYIPRLIYPSLQIWRLMLILMAIDAVDTLNKTGFFGSPSLGSCPR